MKYFISSFLLFTIYFNSSLSLSSQTLNEARTFADNKQYEEARKICYEILKFGYDPDVAVLIGRTFTWEQNYDSARAVIGKALIKFPNYKDAMEAAIDVEFWSGNNKKAIEYCNHAIEKYKEDGSFYLKKANILDDSGSKTEALEIYKQYAEKFPDDKDEINKIRQLKWELKKNEIRYTFTADLFDKDFDRDPWYINSLEYKRDTKAGAFSIRMNYAERFKKTGYQFELDAYPRLNKNNYFYFNYGNSGASVFPKNRLGAEWFHNFTNKFETSVGMRLLFFENSNVDFYTAMLGKYLGNNLISFRAFVTPETDFPSVTTIIETRHFYTGKGNYLGVKLGYGTSPDESRNLINTPQRLQVKSQWLRAEWNQLLSHSWLFGLNLTLGREERLTKEYSGYYSIESRLSFLF